MPGKSYIRTEDLRCTEEQYVRGSAMRMLAGNGTLLQMLAKVEASSRCSYLWRHLGLEETLTIRKACNSRAVTTTDTERTGRRLPHLQHRANRDEGCAPVSHNAGWHSTELWERAMGCSSSFLQTAASFLWLAFETNLVVSSWK